MHRASIKQKMSKENVTLLIDDLKLSVDVKG